MPTMNDVVNDPALKAMRSFCLIASSQVRGSGRMGSPNGGTEPGTRPVSSNSSSFHYSKLRCVCTRRACTIESMFDLPAQLLHRTNRNTSCALTDEQTKTNCGPSTFNAGSQKTRPAACSFPAVRQLCCVRPVLSPAFLHGWKARGRGG